MPHSLNLRRFEILRNFKFIIILVFILGSAAFAFADGGNETNKPKEGAPDKFTFLGSSFTNHKLTIRFALPWEGNVELRLLDKDGTVVFRNQYVRKPGEHSLDFNSQCLEEGVPYNFELQYKLDRIYHRVVRNQ